MATRPAAGEVERCSRGPGAGGRRPGRGGRLLIAEPSAAPTPIRHAELAERALDAGPPGGDPLGESAALDQLTSIQLARARSAPRRPARCGDRAAGAVPVTAASALEFVDASRWPPMRRRRR